MFFLFLFKQLCIWCLWCLKPSFFSSWVSVVFVSFLFSVSDVIHQVDLEGEMELFRHLKVPAVLPSSTNLEASVKGETSTSRSESYADMEIVSTASDEGMEFLLLSDEDEVEVEPPPPPKIKVASTPERKRKAATLEPYTSTYEVAVGDTVKIIKAAGGNTFAIFSEFTWKDWRFNKRGDAGRYVGPESLDSNNRLNDNHCAARGKASQLVLGRHLTSTLKLKWMNISNLQTTPNLRRSQTPKRGLDRTCSAGPSIPQAFLILAIFIIQIVKSPRQGEVGGHFGNSFLPNASFIIPINSVRRPTSTS